MSNATPMGTARISFGVSCDNETTGYSLSLKKGSNIQFKLIHQIRLKGFMGYYKRHSIIGH